MIAQGFFGSHISRRVGVVVDPPAISFSHLFLHFYLFLSIRALVLQHSLFFGGVN